MPTASSNLPDNLFKLATVREPRRPIIDEADARRIHIPVR